MEILVIDPETRVGPAALPAFHARGWQSTISAEQTSGLAAAVRSVPDLIVLHGDGADGEAAHLCQRFKHNPLTAGIPLLLVEDIAPPAWMLPGIPVDAVAQAPWEPADLVHHVEVLQPVLDGTGLMDDLTNFPRRRSLLTELERRMVARELFAAGLLMLREADAYRMDHGRTGLDQFVVLLSVLLRRNAASRSPVSIGYLDEGSFVILGAPNAVHELIAQTMRDFEALVPAFYEMDALFGADEHGAGPATWIGVQGAVCLVEPGRFDNVLQVGFALAETITAGHDAARDATFSPVSPLAGRIAAD